MGKKQIAAIVAPPLLVACMYPVFNTLVDALAVDRLAWFLGLLIYWMLWGLLFPLILIGKSTILRLIRPQSPDRRKLLLTAVPIVLALIVKLLPGMGSYEKESSWLALLIFLTAFGNGFFEELLWRGVYTSLFPDNILLRMIWPCIWFALWHYVPVSALNGNVLGMIIGSGLMGFYLSFLVKRTGSLSWAIIAHTIGGLIMVV